MKIHLPSLLYSVPFLLVFLRTPTEDGCAPVKLPIARLPQPANGNCRKRPRVYTLTCTPTELYEELPDMAAAAAAVIPINSDPGGILVPGMCTWHTIDSTPYLVHMMVARYVMTHLTTRVFFVQLPCKKSTIKTS